MSKKFHAVNRETGERWKPKYNEKIGRKQYLVMYDSGYIGVVTEDFYTYISPLDPREWKIVLHENLVKKYKKQGYPVIAINPNDKEIVPGDSFEGPFRL